MTRHNSIQHEPKLTDRNESAPPAETSGNMLASIPGAIYSKDREGVYLDCNAYLNHIAGYKFPHSLIGKTDFDTPWASIAETILAHDQMVMMSEQTLVIEEFPTLVDGKKAIMLSSKAPLRDKLDHIIGTVGSSVDISDFKKQQFISETSAERIYFENGRNGTFLTKREVECVLLLAKGKSATEISESLEISRRTVEAHIENIKHKTNCYKQFQLGYVLGKYGALLG